MYMAIHYLELSSLDIMFVAAAIMLKVSLIFAGIFPYYAGIMPHAFHAVPIMLIIMPA